MGFLDKMIRKMKRSTASQRPQEPAPSDSASTTGSGIPEAPAHLPPRYVSRRTRELLESLQPIIKQDSTWSKISGKNILLPPEHIKLRQYIHLQFVDGVLTENKALRDQRAEQILSSIAQAWFSEQSKVSQHPASRSYIKAISDGVYKNTVGLAYPVSRSAPAPKIEPLSQELVKEDLLALFEPLIDSIKNDCSNDLEGFLRRWEWDSKQSPKGLPFTINQNQARADEVIKIQEKAYEIKVHYETTAETFDEESFKGKGLSDFVKKTCSLLENYYHELLKLNADLNPNNMSHWQQPSVKKALDFYFGQRAYLFKIIALIQKIPEEDQEHKLNLMKDYKQYIISRYAREAEYQTSYVFPRLGFKVSFGLDKWTKIDAAMEQYRVCCDFPGEEVPVPSPERYQRVRCAGEDGELKKLKGRGLYFRRQVHQAMAETDPFKPLNVYGAVEPIQPYSASLNL